MKVCIILQRTFAVIGNAIAAELKEKHGISEFCGFTYLRRSELFIKNQKDVSYTSILTEEKIHDQFKKEKLDYEYLKHLENKYGLPNLWPYIVPDRTFMMRIPPKEYSMNPSPMYSHEELLKCLQIRFRIIEDWLKKEKPDFMICPLVGAMSTLILYHVAKKMGIQPINTDMARVNNRVSLSEDYNTLTYAENLFKKIKNKEHQSFARKEAKEFLDQFRNKPLGYQSQLIKQSSLKELKFISPKNLLAGIKFYPSFIFNYYKNPHRHDYTTENPWQTIKNKIIRTIRNLQGYADFYSKPDWSQNFCYYQLHYEPEVAISVLAPFQTDQIHLIKQIARSLPVGFELYVREHREMINRRPRKFYKELIKITNVKLIAPNIDLFDLLGNAKLVTTITSTAGWEAALLGKPVVTFGKVFYNALSSVKYCDKMEELPHIVKNQLSAPQINDQELIDYLCALFEESVPFDLLNLWFVKGADYEKLKSDEGLKNFASYLAKKLKTT